MFDDMLPPADREPAPAPMIDEEALERAAEIKTACDDCGEMCITVLDCGEDTGLCTDCYNQRDEAEHLAFLRGRGLI